MSLSPYLRAALDSLYLRDIWSELIKSIVFAVLITQVGCLQGFRVKGRPEDVGRAATSAVRGRLNQVRRSIGMSFQNAALVGSMAVSENAAFPLLERTRLAGSTIDEIVLLSWPRSDWFTSARSKPPSSQAAC